MTYLFVLLSFVALIYGADLMVRGAVNVAGRLGVSTLIIGLTVVAWGTSAPELVVSLRAGFGGNYGIALGNILGSNIANILLIGGFGAVLIVLRTRGVDTARNLWLMLAATLVLALLVLFGSLPRWAGLLLVSVQLVLLILAFRARQGADDVEIEDMSLANASALTLFGAILVIGGGVFLVPNAIAIAEAWHVPQSIIGLSVIAVGTSLPELAATCAAVRRREADLIVGNIVGSNLANILIVFGFTALLTPGELTEPPMIFATQVAVMVLASGILVGLLVWRGRMGRGTGISFLTLYLGFVAYSYLYLAQHA